MKQEKIKIGIIGVGLIGGSIGLGLKSKKFSATIFGFDKINNLQSAKKIGAIDLICNNIIDAVINSDLIILALPIKNNLRVLKLVFENSKPNAIIIDTGSVKKSILDEAAKFKKGKQIFIPTHPMAGKESGGIKSADKELFLNSNFIICSNNKTIPKLLFRVIKTLGAKISFLNPKIHDKIVSEISHLPQIVSIALINSIENKNYSFKFAARGFKDTTRIASSPFNIWKDILEENKNEVLKSINNFKKSLSKIEQSLSENNYGELKKYFSEASKRKKLIKY